MRFPFTGLIAVDKPPGVTSRRVVDAVARAAGMGAVGHAGTLDPLASGVTVVCLGHATRLVDHIHSRSKSYSATFLLGRSSPSDDLETPVEVEESPRVPSREEVELAAGGFRGDILQRPCDYSAVHVAGQRAYSLARKGRPVAVEPRRVRVGRLEITRFEWPRVDLEIECSTGTYVRAIGRDLAVALGTRAVMETLRRTRVGPFDLAVAVPLSAIDAATLPDLLLPARAALSHLPAVVLAGPTLERAARGGLLGDDALSGTGAAVADALVALDEAGDLVGILGRLPDGAWRLRPNFRGAG